MSGLMEMILENNILCSECGEINDNGNYYCVECGHKLQSVLENNMNYKEYCPICKEMINKDMDYCGKYGHKIERNQRVKRCPICGEWNNEERFCLNCGHDFIYNKYTGYKGHHVCPNCGKTEPYTFSYCEDCGTKLIKK